VGAAHIAFAAAELVRVEATLPAALAGDVRALLGAVKLLVEGAHFFGLGCVFAGG
jgi:hypothetical protein